MFLDAWLGLFVWGTLAVLVLLFLVLASLAAIAYGVHLQRKGRSRAFWLLVLPSAAFLAAVAAMANHLLVDQRATKQIVLDLRRPQSEILGDLADVCASRVSDGHCGSGQFKLNVVLIFPEGKELAIQPSSILGSSNSDGSFNYISILGSTSMPLSAGHDLLVANAALLSGADDLEAKMRIAEASNWVLTRNNSNVYSEVRQVHIRPGFALQFRKNVDRIYLDYSILPTR
jgi:hypothetical protein